MPQGPSPDEPGGVYPIRSLPADPGIGEMAPAATPSEIEDRCAAAFQAAEQKRVDALAIAMPIYRGSGETAEVEAFVKKELASWITARRAAVDEAERAYVAVLDIEPEPTPRWVVASGLRVGSLWVGFAQEIRDKTPTPKQWDQPGNVADTEPPLTWAELRATFHAALDRQTQSWVNRGRIALQACARHAERHGVDDAFGRGCKSWIEQHPLARPTPTPAP